MRNFKRISDRSEAAIRPIGPIRKTIPVMRSIKIAIKRIRRTFDAWVAKQPILKSNKEMNLEEDLHDLFSVIDPQRTVESIAKDIAAKFKDLASSLAAAFSKLSGESHG